MLDVIGGFIKELRAAGVPVSLAENLDALRALEHIPMEDRPAFKSAMAATLVKSSSHYRTFDTVFEIYFALRGEGFGLDQAEDASDQDAGQQGAQGGLRGSGGGGEGLSAQDLAQMLERALMEGDEATLRALARRAVTRFAGMEPGRPVGGTYYLYRTLRNLNLEQMLDSLMKREKDKEPQMTSLEEKLAREEYEARISKLRQEIEAEIRRRLVADRGSEAVAKTLRKPLPEDVDLMHAGREEIMSLRKAVAPLARKLAVRLARRRRHQRKGPLDFRRTIRKSLAYGGVPAEPQFKHPRPHKPEMIIIADISGSVAAFARFTLQFVYAMSSQFSKVRSFVFVDGIDEVTKYFENSVDANEAIHRINSEADVIWLDGHSDYGHAFEVFWNKWGDEMTRKASVMILGDARNNYHSSQAWVVQELRRKVRHVYWLNPEPRSYWDTGDSIVSTYAVHCDGVHECRNLRQLQHFVETIATAPAGRLVSP